MISMHQFNRSVLINSKSIKLEIMISSTVIDLSEAERYKASSNNVWMVFIFVTIAGMLVTYAESYLLLSVRTVMK